MNGEDRTNWRLESLEREVRELRTIPERIAGMEVQMKQLVSTVTEQRDERRSGNRWVIGLLVSAVLALLAVAASVLAAAI